VTNPLNQDRASIDRVPGFLLLVGGFDRPGYPGRIDPSEGASIDPGAGFDQAPKEET
jgi:hypothetical protein